MRFKPNYLYTAIILCLLAYPRPVKSQVDNVPTTPQNNTEEASPALVMTDSKPHATTAYSSKDHHMGHADTNIKTLICTFCESMTNACKLVLQQMETTQPYHEPKHSDLFRALNPKQRKALDLFAEKMGR